MTDIKSMTERQLADYFKNMGQPAFRAKQVFTWLHRGVRSFDEMTDLSKPLRAQLAETCFITAPTVARKQTSKLDGTVKYLWELADGNCIETVLMQYHHGNTVCISSQVGCRMGCAFCASTIAGKVRDLRPSELLDQVLFTQLDSGLPVSNIVLMGIGEPLDNMDNVLRFLELVNSPHGMNIGMRHISLSTCGVVPGIDALADRQLQLTLSVSLHAPDSETRSRIMPVNRAYDVETLFAACHRYFQKTGRRISFEYAMIDGVNDHDWQAELIAKKLKGMPGHVNLIPLNDVVESPYKPSRRIGAFQPPPAGGWAAISTPPAASCGGRKCRNAANCETWTLYGIKDVSDYENVGDHQYRVGAERESGRLRRVRGRRIPRGRGVRRYGRHQRRTGGQRHRRSPVRKGAARQPAGRYGHPAAAAGNAQRYRLRQ